MIVMDTIKTNYDRVITAKARQKKRERNAAICWTCKWPGPGTGRWWKRKLSKARRRYAKMTLQGIRYKEPNGIESEVNWKTW
jgi:hypothetical protein